MYCSSCGSTVGHNLVYCNHCGAKLFGAQTDLTKTGEASAESLVWAIVAVFVVGLGCIIGLMAVMKNELHLNDGLLIFFSLLSFALMISVEAVFIWLLISRSRRGNKWVKELAKKEKETKELGAAPPRVLGEPTPMPLASVTEHTTRTFEPVYDERK